MSLSPDVRTCVNLSEKYYPTKLAIGERKTRIKFNETQVLGLEEAFKRSRYPDYDQLSDTLRIGLGRIKVWFQNKRARFPTNTDKLTLKSKAARICSKPKPSFKLDLSSFRLVEKRLKREQKQQVQHQEEDDQGEDVDVCGLIELDRNLPLDLRTPESKTRCKRYTSSPSVLNTAVNLSLSRTTPTYDSENTSISSPIVRRVDPMSLASPLQPVWSPVSPFPWSPVTRTPLAYDYSPLGALSSLYGRPSFPMSSPFLQDYVRCNSNSIASSPLFYNQY